jgi:DNA helicase-2/ATP-dependent DNA helicase PcrA
LEAFLEQAALVNDTDAWEVEHDRVTLMTVHAAKGLEFPVVFMIALEEGIFPHERSRNDGEQLEEERRLLFVAITRAKEELHLSRACYRHYRGQFRPTVPSAFLMELPQEELDFQQPQAAGHVPVQPTDFESDEMGDDTGDFGSDEFEFPPRTSSLPLPLGEGRCEGAGAVASAMLAARLTTAADLAARQSEDPTRESPLSPISPEVFHQGMIVRHPNYGLGKIVALSGGGTKRKATVVFAAGHGEKHFQLAQSPLRPAST